MYVGAAYALCQLASYTFTITGTNDASLPPARRPRSPPRCSWPHWADATRHIIKNPSHPNYGDSEYKDDLAQCRKQNSKIVIVSGYDDRAETQVDEAKARSCMTERGWQAVSR